MPKMVPNKTGATEPDQATNRPGSGSERIDRMRTWLQSEASLESVLRSLEKNAISASDALGPIHEWIDFRLSKDSWIQGQLAIITSHEAANFKLLIYDAILAFSRKYYGSTEQQIVPHVHRKHKKRAQAAIKKLVTALKELNFDPDITYLIDQAKHEWAKQLLIRETDETPREASLFAQMFQNEQIDQDVVEELRGLWHARKQVPKAQDLLKALDFRLTLLNATLVLKFSARSMFLREIWSGLGAHTLEKKRMKFVTHVDDAVFPGHWTGEPEARLRELNRITSDLRKKELWFKKFFPELHSQLGS